MAIHPTLIPRLFREVQPAVAAVDAARARKEFSLAAMSALAAFDLPESPCEPSGALAAFAVHLLGDIRLLRCLLFRLTLSSESPERPFQRAPREGEVI